MNRIRLIVTRDFRRRLRSPAGILILTAIPLLMTAIFGIVFSPGEKSRQLSIRVLVVDNDRNFGARMLMQAFSQERFAEMFRMETVNEEDGRREIARGKASALLVIPKDFTAALFLSRPVQLEVVKNPSEQFLPGVVEEFTRTAAVLAAAAQAVFREELAAMRPLWDRSFNEIETTEFANLLDSLRPKINRLRRVLDPLLVGLDTQDETSKPEAENQPAFDISEIFALILPGMAILFMMFIVEIFMREILSEKEDGTLRRLLFSPIPPIQYVAAKITSAWLMGLVILGLMAAMGSVVLAIRWGNFFYFLVLGGAVLAALCGLFALFYAFFRNRNQAGVITSPVILVFAALGGSMIPVNQLPAGFRAFSRFTPNYWFIQGTALIRAGEFPVTAILLLLAVGLVLTVASLPLLVRRVSP
ncbi:MAG: ABC transporter permease [Candidatus Aminicenantes bacterium]|nr:ABC transporter permease [Candidatus Aminicenantes bacterium]